MAKRIAVATSLALALLVPALAAHQAAAAQAPPAAAAGDEKPEEGIPIASEAVQKACRSCHRVDDQKRMTRISYRRTTPEGWQQAVRRMVSLNDAVLDPDEAREVVKYLANNLGLAPDEARIGAFEVERRMIEYKYAGDKDTEQTCTKCHSFGRVLLERRTKEDWDLLIAMHRGFYPLVDFQAFRRVGPPQREPGQPPSVRESGRAPLGDLPAADAGMGGVVGDDEAAAPAGTLGGGRLSDGKRAGVRRRHDRAEAGCR
jgi:quinohemoprotein amine dehydrogenase